MNALVKLPIEGEIIAPDEMLAVVAVMHPMREGHQIVMVPVGASLSEIIEACGRECEVSGLAGGVYVELNGQPIPKAIWPQVRPKAGCHILVRAVPKGFIAPLLATAIGGAFGITNTFIVGILTAAISLGLNYLLSALFAPSNTTSEDADPIYSISGSRNRVSKWGPVPSVLGRVRMAPLYASAPYNEFSGHDQYIRMLMVWGYGPLSISDIKIGETRIADFDEAEIQTRFGYLTDAEQTLFTRAVVQEDLQITLSRENGPHIRTSAEDAVQLAVDLVAPNGIFGKGKSGPTWTEVRFRLEYKPEGAPDSAYAGLRNDGVRDLAWGGNSTDPQRRSYARNVPAGRYTVRITRQSEDPSNDGGSSTSIVWTAIRIRRATRPIQFDKPLAISAIRIKASEELNGVPDDINGLVTTRCRIFSGGSWINDTAGTPRTSRNPGELFRHVLQGPGNKRPVPDSRLDLPTIQAFVTYCRSKGFTFDMVRDFRASVWETLRDVCAAGRGMPIFRDGKWSVAWEEQNGPIVQHFTPVNSWNMVRRQEYRTLPHALRVKFLNADKSFIEDERLVYADGYTKANATLVEQIEFPGITSPALIHKHARYRLAEGKLRPATFNLMVDAEHLVCTRGDRVVVGHDVLMNNLANGRVAAVAAQTVTLVEDVLLEAGVSYGIRFRRSNGTSLLRSVVPVGAGGYYRTLTLVGTATIPDAGDLFSFGPSGRETGTYKVKAIRPGEDLSAELELVDDAPGIQDADDGPIPDYDSGLVVPIDPAMYKPVRLSVVESTELRGQSADFVAALLWDVLPGSLATAFTAEARDANGVTRRVDTTELAARFLNLTPGNWTFRVLARFPDSVRNIWSETITVTILGASRPAGSLDQLRIDSAAGLSTLTWQANEEPVLRYEVRFSPLLMNVQWEQMLPLGEAIDARFQTPTRDGTYAVKPISYAGVAASSAIFATISGAEAVAINQVATLAEPGTWTGDRDAVIVQDGDLQLVVDGNIFAVEDVFALADFFVPGGQPRYVESGTYVIPGYVDLGDVYTSRVAPSIVARGGIYGHDIFDFDDFFAQGDVFGFDGSDWNVKVQVSTTDQDPALGVWSGWADMAVSEATGRALRFRLVLQSIDPSVTPIVESASIVVDMPDRTEWGKDVPAPTVGLRVNFTPPFMNLGGLNITAQDLASGDRWAITGKDQTGFNIIFRNSAGTAVARTFDWTAVGYGVRH